MPTWSLRQHAALVLNFRRYHFIGTALESDIAPVRNMRHARWRRRHTHRHHFREVLIGLSGQSRYGFKDHIYPVAPGTVLLFDADEEHDAWYPSFGTPCRHLWIHESVTPSPLTALCNICEVRSHHFTLMPCMPVMLPSLEHFWRSWDRLKTQPKDLLSRSRFLAAFAALMPDIFEQSLETPVSQDVEELNRRRLVQEIADVIKNNLDGDLSLDHLARLAGYSKFHFLRMFQRHQRCSLRQYIHRVKSQRATQLLRGGMKAAAVAQVLGFSTPSAFHRFFLRQTGNRPSEC